MFNDHLIIQEERSWGKERKAGDRQATMTAHVRMAAEMLSVAVDDDENALLHRDRQTDRQTER